MSLRMPEAAHLYLEDGTLKCGYGPQCRERAATAWLRQDGQDWVLDYFRCPSHPPGGGQGRARAAMEELAAYEVHEG